MNGNASSAHRSSNSTSSAHSSSTPSRTIVKYEKSSCLFCNEWFDSQTFTEHLIHCGQVFESCPNSCNAYVPRIRMRAHLKECPRAHNNEAATLGDDCERRDLQHSERRLQVLEQDIDALRSVLNEEIRQRLHLITDVGSLRKQNQITNDWTQRTNDLLSAMQKRLQEQSEQHRFEVEQSQQDFRYCYELTQTLKGEIQHDIDDLQKHTDRISLELTAHQNKLNGNIMKLEESLLQLEKRQNAKLQQLEEFLHGVADDLKTKSVANADLSSKQATLDYEVRSMKNIVCETEERCDKLQSEVAEIEKQLHATAQAFSDLEHHLATQQRLASILNTRGHIVWCIKDYSKKLQDAKQYDTILHSAMFSNKQFGYALRLDIHLNGKGGWKGRNMISCLNVLAGEYDPLLTWPCRLQADIIIRDQCASPAEAQDYVKTIHVRKKSDEYLQTNQFFHIPHKVITSRNYLRNDCLFVEVKVHK